MASDLVRFQVELPVVRPRRAGDRECDMRLVSLLCSAYCVLLRITPSIPCALDCALNQLEPFFVHLAAGRRWQREQLPQAVFANQRDDGLPARPPYVPVRPRVLWVG